MCGGSHADCRIFWELFMPFLVLVHYILVFEFWVRVFWGFRLVFTKRFLLRKPLSYWMHDNEGFSLFFRFSSMVFCAKDFRTPDKWQLGNGLRFKWEYENIGWIYVSLQMPVKISVVPWNCWFLLGCFWNKRTSKIGVVGAGRQARARLFWLVILHLAVETGGLKTLIFCVRV